MTVQVHPTALVADGAELGDGVTVGAFAVIGPAVRLAERCRVMAHAVLDGHTELGPDCVIHPTAVVGGPPQDLKYGGEPTHLVVGARNIVREGVTLNVGTVHGGGVTRIGDDNMFMACSHVAHDCVVGNHVILANNVMLAGHVVVRDGAILNGGVGIHHFTTVGTLAYVGGLSRITRDVPPYHIVEGHPSRVRGVNVIGMRRAGLPEEAIAAVKGAYKLLYRADLTMQDALARLRVDFADVAEVQRLVEFLEASGGGRQGRQGEDPNRRHS